MGLSSPCADYLETIYLRPVRKIAGNESMAISAPGA